MEYSSQVIALAGNNTGRWRYWLEMLQGENGMAHKDICSQAFGRYLKCKVNGSVIGILFVNRYFYINFYLET